MIGTCTIPGCTKKLFATRVCSMHYFRAKKGQPIDGRKAMPKKEPPKKAQCKESGCSESAACKGLCRRHYNRNAQRKRAELLKMEKQNRVEMTVGASESSGRHYDRPDDNLSEEVARNDENDDSSRGYEAGTPKYKRGEFEREFRITEDMLKEHAAFRLQGLLRRMRHEGTKHVLLTFEP